MGITNQIIFDTIKEIKNQIGEVRTTIFNTEKRVIRIEEHMKTQNGRLKTVEDLSDRTFFGLGDVRENVNDLTEFKKNQEAKENRKEERNYDKKKVKVGFIITLLIGAIGWIVSLIT